MKKFLVFFIFFLVNISYSLKTGDDLVKEALKEIEEISAADLSKIIGKEDITIIDVREPEEVKEGKIKGSLNIPRGVLEFKISEVIKDPNKKVIVYCKKGGRGALAAQTLKKMGYKKVYSLKGGIVSWQAAGLEIEK